MLMTTPTLSEVTLENLILEAAEAVRPAKRMTVSQSAEEYRKLNNPGAYVGPWLNNTTPYLVEPMDVLQSQRFTGMAFAGPAQTGKSLALDTPIATPSGWVTMGGIEVGDEVFGADGKPTRVLVANPVQHDRPCYRVVFDDGTEIVADGEHRWLVEDVNRGKPRIVTTEEMVFAGVLAGKRARYSVRIAPPLELPKEELFMDPYVLGVWLGDGSELYGYVSCGRDDEEALVAEIVARGYKTTTYKPSSLHRCYALGVRGPDGVFIDQYLSTMGLGGGLGKRIPAEYLRSSEPQRRELLRGLCDTDGGLSGPHKRAVQFTSVDESLARQVSELAVSLGFKARLKYKPGLGRGSWNVLFTIYNGEDAFSIPRKRNLPSAEKNTRRGETSRRFIRAIDPVDSVPVRCIGVAADDHLFLAGTGMVATHNTDMALNWVGYSAKCDPADMMIVQTSQTTSRDFSIRRIDRLHRHSTAIGAMLAAGTQSDNTFDKQYRSGMMLSMSWPAINELSGKPIPRLWLTDYDRMPENIDGEGDPFSLARKRATTFRSHGMCAAESSPGYVVENPKWIRHSKHEAPPTKGILSIYNDGDRRLWYWQCVTCQEWFEPDFGLLRWPDLKDAMESGEQATLHCPHCDQEYHHDPKDGLPGKHILNHGGKWVPDYCTIDKDGVIHGTSIRSTIASFWLKGVAAAFADWKTLVNNYIVAERDYENTQSEEKLKTTVNTDQGHPYTPKSMSSDRVPEVLKGRAKPLAQKEVPVGVRFLIATIDVQKNRFVVQVHGIHTNKDISVIDRFDIRKSKRIDPEGERYWVNPGAHPEDWKLISEEVLSKTYPLIDASGRRMGVRFTVCDSGGKAGTTSNAYDFYRWLRHGDDPDVETEDEGEYEWHQANAGRFLLLKGASTKTAPRVSITYPDSQRKDRHAGARGEIPVLMLNTNLLKDTLSNMLDRVEPGNGVLFPDWLDDNFFIELTVEVRDPVKGWLNPKNYRNESWDLLAYCLAAQLTPTMNVDHIDWKEPPRWAEEWDINDLVFDPEIEDKPFNDDQKPKKSLKDLASSLA